MIMKKSKQKKLIIPFIATACMMYGCSSQPVSSSGIESTAEVQIEESKAEEANADASQAGEQKSGETASGEITSEEAKSGTKQSSEPSQDADKNDTDSTGNDTDKENEENKEDTSDSDTDKTNDEDKNDKTDENSDDRSEENTQESNEKNDKIIQNVKDAHPETFPGCTYGKAFEEFFTSPQWKYFESTDGRDVVEFTGECIYAGAPTKTRMQFIVSKNNSVVTTGALYYNNTPQNANIIAESINRIFEQYAKAHDIAYTPAASSSAQTSQTNALPPETSSGNESAQNTQTQTAQNQTSQNQNTQNQNTQNQNTQNQNTQNQNTQNQNTQNQNTQNQNTNETTTIRSGGTQAALEFAAWTNPDIGSWHSPSTGYYIIPYIDNAGNPSLRFANENTQAASATIYYTDAVSAVTNDVGGLTYQAYLYKPSGENQQLVGMVEVSWNSIAELKALSVKMINGNQTMDNSMAGSDYTYFGAVN